MKGISRSRQGTRQEKVVRGEHDQIIHVRKKKKKMKLVYANKNPHRYMHPHGDRQMASQPSPS